MRLLWLPDVLRQWGLHVQLIPGWDKRGAPFQETPRVPVAHHTATARSRTLDYPSLRIVRDGRGEPNPLPGPLSQVGLGYSGTVYVIAAGKANHAGPGAWRGVPRSSLTIGCEAESPGDGTWTPQQRRAYPLLMAALCDGLGTTAEMVCAHREWALPPGRKVDPTGIDMPEMRQQVTHLLKVGPAGVVLPPHPPTPTPPAPPALEDDMQALFKTADDPRVFITDGVTKRHVTSQAELAVLIAAGLVTREIKQVTPEILTNIPTVRSS